MTNTDTRDAASTLRQIDALTAAGCEIIRVAVPDENAVKALPEIIANSRIPVIADIHFDYRLAVASIRAGIHGIRINPGNIGHEDNVRRVAEAAGEAGIPIRVGANSGSINPSFLNSCCGTDHDQQLAEALVSSAMQQCQLLEKYDFNLIKVSLKASSVAATVLAYKAFAQRAGYPLHLGVTEAGTLYRGNIKSAVGIGSLLLSGIGDTIRVSLTADPLEEIKTGIRILEYCGLRDAEVDIIACPTCGRTEIDLFTLAGKVEALVEQIKQSGKKIKLKKIAVMGCVVNGPGEAKDADIGIAGGKNQVILFKHGKIIGTYSESEGFAILQQEIIAAAQI
jgi:(E)-4-hydroxy-3-methylbut-2-enyl-diphosphate synthase